MSTRERGIIHRWNAERAFGFLRPDHGGDRDVFAHVTDFPRDLVPAVGMCVEYDIVDDRGRPKAVNVRAPS